LRALAKDPAERYQSAAEMAEELELIAGQVDQPQTWNQIARLYQSGIRAFEERRWDLAIMRFAQLLAFDPNYEDAADLMAAARDAQERARVEALHQTQLVHQSAVVPRRSTPSLSASPLRRSTPSLSASPLRAGSPTLLLSPQPAVTAVVSHDALDAVRAPSPRRDWRWPAVPVVLVMLLLLGGIGTRQREGPGSQGASATAPPSSAQAPLSLPTIRQGLIDAIVAPAAAAELLASSTSVVPKVFQALTEQTTPEASTRQTPTLTAPKPTPATAKPLPAAGAASAEVILLQVAEAEAALRMGQLEATITYGSGARSSARVRFDLGDEQRVPCFQIITTYEGAKSIQTTERITIGDQSWERQQDSQSTAMPARESALKQLQVFLPRTDSISDIKRVTAEGRYVLRWYDSARDADVTLRVDAAGIPQQLRRVSRANGLVLTVTYSDWNTPVEISPPTAN
jgi:hypothetical protein